MNRLTPGSLSVKATSEETRRETAATILSGMLASGRRNTTFSQHDYKQYAKNTVRAAVGFTDLLLGELEKGTKP